MPDFIGQAVDVTLRDASGDATGLIAVPSVLDSGIPGRDLRDDVIDSIEVESAAPAAAIATPAPIVSLATDSPIAFAPEAAVTTVALSDGVVRDTASVPWRLQSNSRMSWSSSYSNILPTPGPVDLAEARGTQSLQHSVSPPNASVPGLMRPVEWTAESAVQSLNAMAKRSAPAASQSDAVLDSVSENAWLTPWAAWPERLLRWHPDSSGGQIAWIRDFRLSSEDTPTLIDSLRQLADQQGQTLRRIMLNGHEVWRATTHSNPKG